MFDYESPITQIVSDMQMGYENGVLKAVQSVGFHVNKEELTKALAYDRGQYDKGYEDGLNADKWIPCSERLPNKEEYQKCNGQFIVSDGNRTYATYFDIYDTLKFGEPTIERFRVDRVVIAWQPLPAPSQKGE